MKNLHITLPFTILQTAIREGQLNELAFFYMTAGQAKHAIQVPVRAIAAQMETTKHLGVNNIGKRGIGNLNLQMDVGGHEAKRVDFEGETQKSGVQDRIEAEAVLVVGKDVPTIIASQDHMVHGPRYVDAFFSRHGASIAQVTNISIPGTIIMPLSASSASKKMRKNDRVASGLAYS